jgi:flavin-dependent dehydrogenase
VLLIEKADRETFKVGESLPPAITPLLRELGVFERFKADRHLISAGNESSWGGASLERAGFIHDPVGQAWHVDRPRFDAMLRDAARDAGAHVVEATRVAKCERCDAGDWRLALEGIGGSSQSRASWLIDCTGRRSWLARREGVKRRAYDNLMAFVAVFHENEAVHDKDCDSVTLVESVEEGWWYTARVPNGRRVVVYLTDTVGRSSDSARTEEGYRALLEDTVHIRSRLQSYSMSGAPMITSSNSSRLERVAGAGWLAAGDAATSFDPLSSQGVLTAAYSGLKAGRALHSHLSGDFDALRSYQLRIGAVYDGYLANRVECYRFEGRWPQSEFWRKRRQILQTTSKP